MKIDIRRINDPKYMKERIRENHLNYKNLGAELLKDKEFILEVIEMDEFYLHYADLYEMLHEDLKKDTDMAIQYIRIIKEKRGTRDLMNFISHNFSAQIKLENEVFWKAMKELGVCDTEHPIIRYHIGKSDKMEYSKSLLWRQGLAKERKAIAIELCKEITPQEMIERTQEADRCDEEFMLELITRNEEMYLCLADILKQKKEYINKLIEANPNVKIIIEQENEEIEKKEKIKKAERQKRIEEKQELKVRKKVEDVERKKREYEELRENHPIYRLVNDFLESNASKKMFCDINNIKIEDLDTALREIVDVYPEYEIKIENKNKHTQAIYLEILKKIKVKLLSGEMTLKQYSKECKKDRKIKDLLGNANDIEDRKRLQLIILEAIGKGDLNMMDYYRLFAEQCDYRTIVSSINSIIQNIRQERPELRGKGKAIENAQTQIRELKKYEKPYFRGDFINTERGFIDSKDEEVWITVTDEHLDYAKMYLKLEDEYICYSTMNKTIGMLVRGEITIEEIEKRVAKRNAEMKLRKKEEKLQELEQHKERLKDKLESLKKTEEQEVGI